MKVRPRLRRGVHVVSRLAFTSAIALTLIDVCCGTDLATCNGELAQMQGDRRDIAARADAVATAIEQFEICVRQTIESGKVADGCRRLTGDYRKAVARLNSAVDGADARVRAIGGSCAQDAAEVRPSDEVPRRSGAAQAPPSLAAPQPPVGVNASCDLARSYKHKIPFEGVVKICERSMSEAECRVCLGPADDQ